MGLELYLNMLSQPCRAVYIFAKRNGIPFELRTVDLLKGQQVSKEFSQINSLQKVPALKDNDFTLAESVAILIYLSNKYQTAAHWYPPDPQARVLIHEYLSWHADCIRGVFGVPLWAQVLAPLLGSQVPKDKVERNKTFMEQALQQLEAKFLKDKAFLTGHQVTLADLMALEELIQPLAVGYNVFEGRPRLAAWRERVEAFLGAELCQEAHSSVMSIMEKAASRAIPAPSPEAYPALLLRITKIP